MKLVKPLSILPIVTLTAGVIVLAGYFVDVPWLAALRNLLLEWAIVLAGMLILSGVLKLGLTHWQAAKSNNGNKLYNFVLVAAMLVTFILLVWDRTSPVWSTWLLKAVFLPIESSLVAMLAFVLLAAAVRLAFYRRDRMAVVFLLAAGLTLLSSSPAIVVQMPGMITGALRSLTLLAANAGVRGLLIGVALGAATVALRFLLGYDRPQDGS